MLGALIIAAVLFFGIPMLVMASSPLIAAAFGQTLTAEAEVRHEGSELIELNK